MIYIVLVRTMEKLWSDSSTKVTRKIQTTILIWKFDSPWHTKRQGLSNFWIYTKDSTQISLPQRIPKIIVNKHLIEQGVVAQMVALF